MSNKFKNGVVASGGEFLPIETEEERQYLQEQWEFMILDMEWDVMYSTHQDDEEEEDEERGDSDND